MSEKHTSESSEDEMVDLKGHEKITKQSNMFQTSAKNVVRKMSKEDKATVNLDKSDTKVTNGSKQAGEVEKATASMQDMQLEQQSSFPDKHNETQVTSESNQLQMVPMSSQAALVSKNYRVMDTVTKKHGTKYENESNTFSKSFYVGVDGKLVGLESGAYSLVGVCSSVSSTENKVTAITLYESVSAVWYFPLFIKQYPNSILGKLFSEKKATATATFCVESTDFCLSEKLLGNYFQAFCVDIRELTYRGRITENLFKTFFNHKECIKLDLLIVLPFVGNLKKCDIQTSGIGYQSEQMSWRKIAGVIKQSENLRILTVDVRSNDTLTYGDVVFELLSGSLNLEYLKTVVSTTIDCEENIITVHNGILSLLADNGTAFIVIDSCCKAFVEKITGKVTFVGMTQLVDSGSIQQWLSNACLSLADYDGLGFMYGLRNQKIFYFYRVNSNSVRSRLTIPEVMRLRTN